MSRCTWAISAAICALFERVLAMSVPLLIAHPCVHRTVPSIPIFHKGEVRHQSFPGHHIQVGQLAWWEQFAMHRRIAFQGEYKCGPGLRSANTSRQVQKNPFHDSPGSTKT